MGAREHQDPDRSSPGYSGFAASSSAAASCVFPATPSEMAYFALDAPPLGAAVGLVAANTSTINSATRSKSAPPKPREVSAGVPMRMPEVYHAPFGSRGIELRL